jgi:hypothetical protein
VKIGLSVRIGQVLNLQLEPEGRLPYADQEERSRLFWSIYLLDRLVPCGRARPPAILYEDCHIQLPCDEMTFRERKLKKTPTLGEALETRSSALDQLGNFALVIAVACILGQCTRYTMQERRDSGTGPPWGSKSEFAAINSAVLCLESNFELDTSIKTIIVLNHIADDKVYQHTTGHLVFSHALHNLCHCLLYHPFLLHRRLQSLNARPPPSFLSRALQLGRDRARAVYTDTRCQECRK